ncbi:MAG TPA: xanthine dehydrogenase family protein subunit M [Symbiobacteriaceae bacterium]|nr:xanthine dehydrogenase family protein subunit M [Symbiobacteriaceae bacterium]
MFAAAFDYVRAESVAHALQLMQQHGPDAKLIAGGHSLLPAMRLRLAQPKTLIDIGRILELQFVREEGNDLVLGALATHYQILAAPLVKARCPALAETAEVVADMQVRNKGTIGGAIAHADPAADYPAILLALGATVEMQGMGGTRRVPIDQFFTGPFETALQPDEVLTAIRVPKMQAGEAAVYRKFTRRQNDYGMTGIACFLKAGPDKVCTEIRVGITCVGLSAYRAKATEGVMRGARMTPERIQAAAEEAITGVDVSGDAYVPADYRAALCQVETRRAIEDCIAQLGLTL